MQRSIWTRLKSRKFLMSVATTLLICINEVSGKPINEEAYWVIALLVVGWVAGESYVDGRAVYVDMRDYDD